MTVWYMRIIRIIRQSTKTWTQLIRGPTQTFLASPQQIRTVKLALTIIIVFVVCWTPYMLITLIQIYSGGRFRPPSWFDGVLQILSLHQSGLNPFIYMIFNQRRKYSITIIRAAGSTFSQTFDRRERKRSGLMAGSVRGEMHFRNRVEEKSQGELQLN